MLLIIAGVVSDVLMKEVQEPIWLTKSRNGTLWQVPICPKWHQQTAPAGWANHRAGVPLLSELPGARP